MSVTTLLSSIGYTGSGFILAFPFPFYVWEDADLSVTVNGVLQVLTTNYTLSGFVDSSGGRPAGGTVNFLAGQAPGQGSLVVISRITPKTQTTTYVDGAPFTGASLNRALDKLTLMIQEIAIILGLGGFQGTLSSDPVGPSSAGDWYVVLPFQPGGPMFRCCTSPGTPGVWHNAGDISE